MNYIGNCTEDEAWETIFSDASDMACVIENSVKMRLEKFVKIVNPNLAMYKLILNMPDVDFGYHKARHIGWAYDSVNDIHYFWH